MKSTRHPIPLSLYVHFPWCIRKCPYCDFNSHPVGVSLNEDHYVQALLADLDFELSEIRNERELISIFLGGGTPSLLTPESWAKVLDGIANRFSLSEGAEITMEANPGTSEHTDFSACHDAGINRLSIGIQSFNDDRLRSLGRSHTAMEAVNTFHRARKAGFQNINLDLMFGLPGQNYQGALHDITQAVTLNPEHISLYQLTLEPNTVFYRYPPLLPADDEVFHMQEALQSQLELAGFHRYELSAYAKDGMPCQHNLNYWTFGDYIGIGAGAHGKLTTSHHKVHRRARKKHPATWLASAGTHGAIAKTQDIVGPEILFEFFMNALRLRRGFNLPMGSERTGHSTDSIERMLAPLFVRDLVFKNHDRIACTEQGYLFLDDALSRILPSTKLMTKHLDSNPELASADEFGT